MTSLNSKQAALRSTLAELESVLVAYSGGVDSSYLLWAAVDALGAAKVAAATARSPIYPDSDSMVMETLPAELGVRHLQLETRQLEDDAFTRNPADRCYYCKLGVLRELTRIAQQEGFRWIVEGSNVDDLSDYRPGEKAVQEVGARSPLREAGLTKTDIRALAQKAGLPVWDKPAESCLAARFPYGFPISEEALERVRLAERVVKGLGFGVVRVRDYQTLARIEVHPDEIRRLVSTPHAERVVKELRQLGYAHIAVDLQGYRRGSLNEVLDCQQGQTNNE